MSPFSIASILLCYLNKILTGQIAVVILKTSYAELDISQLNMIFIGGKQYLIMSLLVTAIIVFL
jgi:hypothetical protein